MNNIMNLKEVFQNLINAKLMPNTCLSFDCCHELANNEYNNNRIQIDIKWIVEHIDKMTETFGKTFSIRKLNDISKHI